MFSQYEVVCSLREELPQISESFYPTRIGCCVYTSLQTLADYSEECIKKHHFNIARKCFALAAGFRKYGDSLVKNAVENTFIDSVCTFSEQDPRQEIVIQAMMPAGLLKIYIKKKLNRINKH